VSHKNYTHCNHTVSKLELTITVYQRTHLFMESKTTFVMCLYSKYFMSYRYLCIIHNTVEIKLILIAFYVETAMFFVHMEKYYTSMDLPLHGEQIELNFIFAASFSRKL